MMCCESEFTEKVSVEEAFDAALILHYNVGYRGPFGHESFLRKMFGSWEIRKTTPLDIINAFKQELKSYQDKEFSSMNVYTRGADEDIEIMLYAEGEGQLMIEWAYSYGPLRATWVRRGGILSH